MGAERRRLLLLGLVALLLAVVVYQVRPKPSSPPADASRQGGAKQQPESRNAASAGGPDVRLEALSEGRPEPELAERNLFRFRPKTPPPAPERTAAPARPANAAPAVPSAPPPPPPIPLKFIGIVDVPGQSKKIVALSDTKGHVFHGVEGDTVDGRYKILKVGVESIEMSYIDGRGRQTLRLTGGS